MNFSPTKNLERRGFTLIELLFVIAIIAVLSSLALGVMKSAQDDAKEAATEARIRQIEQILQTELEDYEVRRLPVALSDLAGSVFSNPLYGDVLPQPSGDGRPDYLGLQVRNLKRRVMQDIISAELPRPLIDVDGGGTPIRDADGNLTFKFNTDLGVFPTTEPPGTGGTGFTDWLNVRHPGLRGFLNGFRSSRVRAWGNFRSTLVLDPTLDANGETHPRYFEKFNLPGEYLYQTLAQLDIDGTPAIELLGNQAIGNSDDDAFLEVVDAFGEPMQMRIWQIDAIEVEPSSTVAPPNTAGVTDNWVDKTPDVGAFPPIDFEAKDPDGVPQGYAVINPSVPRPINKVRFEIISTRLVY
jgi:prepilin-type N-terminal cleavage/methylation domain-containing protein